MEIRTTIEKGMEIRTTIEKGEDTIKIAFLSKKYFEKMAAGMFLTDKKHQYRVHVSSLDGLKWDWFEDYEKAQMHYFNLINKHMENAK